MLVVINLDAEKALSSLVVSCHRDFLEKEVYLLVRNTESLEHRYRPLLHDILGTGAGRHTRHLGTDTLPDNGFPERPSCDRTSMDLHDLVAMSPGNGSLPLDHELAVHEDLGPVGVLVAVQELSSHNAAEVLYLLDFPINCLLENLVDDLKVA